MRTSDLIAVFVGGGIGSLCRYAVSLVVLQFNAVRLPIATIIANVLSCMIMAWFLFQAADRIPEGSWMRPFILVGICGGFSTFSSFSLENFLLMKQGAYGILFVNILLSVFLCILVFLAFHRAVKGA